MNNSVEKMLEHIIAMQSWAVQNPTKHSDLLTHLMRVRAELEKL
jgi:hypothetical protein